MEAPSPGPRPEEPSSPSAHPDEDRMRREGGPHDQSLYTCGCGYVFEAEVTASVSCPRCRQAQAW